MQCALRRSVLLSLRNVQRWINLSNTFSINYSTHQLKKPLDHQTTIREPVKNDLPVILSHVKVCIVSSQYLSDIILSVSCFLLQNFEVYGVPEDSVHPQRYTDKGKLNVLYKRNFLPHGNKFSEFEDSMFGPEKLIECLVAEKNDTKKKEIIGLIFFYFVYSTWEGKTVYINNLFVKDTERRQGIASNLLREAMLVRQFKIFQFLF